MRMINSYLRIFSGSVARHALRLAVALSFLFGGAATHAVIQTISDVTVANVFDNTIPILINPLGNFDTGDITIGTDDTGGLFINVASDPGPLRSDVAVLGESIGSSGAASIDGIPADWLIGGGLTIGFAGFGEIDIFDSGLVQVGSKTAQAPAAIVLQGSALNNLTTIGRSVDGHGRLTLTNTASRLVTRDLIVGDLGYGNVEVSAEGFLYCADAFVGNGDGSIGEVTITDASSRWNVGDSSLPNTAGFLTIGNAAGTPTVGDAALAPQVGDGQGSVLIASQAVVQVSQAVTIGRLGTLKLQTQGRLRILPTSTTVNSIDNRGTISGDGFIDITGNNATAHTFRNFGVISNRAGTNEGTFGTIQREELIITGRPALVNGDRLVNQSGGLIESIGGEMDFRVPVVNAVGAKIFARDAVMKFLFGVAPNPPGLQNNGTLILAGETTIIGNILTPTLPPVNGANPGITVIPTGANVVIIGSVGPPVIPTLIDDDPGGDPGTTPGYTWSFAIGDNQGSLTIDGAFDVTGTTLDLDFSALESPVLGDVFELISVSGGISGTFANSSVTVGTQSWDIGYSSNSVFVTYAGLAAGLPGDFDGDGDVDGRDFLYWQRNPSTGDLPDWQSGYDDNGPLTGDLSSVPEPSSLLLLLSATVGCLGFKRR